MGVKSYIGKNGETLWAASAYSRSRALPALKIEKQRTGFSSEREAQIVCKQLNRECEREILAKEAQGSASAIVITNAIRAFFIFGKEILRSFKMSQSFRI
jgi:hypothetical protein